MRLLLILSTLSLAGVVLGEYETFAGLNNTYNLHKERVTWETADRVCQLEGGHLMVINSEDEVAISNLLFGRIQPFVPPLPWRYDVMHVGINDKEQEGVWRTVLGGLVSDTGFDVWRRGEPNNHRRVEDCGAISRVGTFSDLRCSSVEHLCPFVCEKEAVESVIEGMANDVERLVTPNY